MGLRTLDKNNFDQYYVQNDVTLTVEMFTLSQEDERTATPLLTAIPLNSQQSTPTIITLLRDKL